MDFRLEKLYLENPLVKGSEVITQNNNKFNIFPNPAQDKITIKGVEKGDQWIITDLMGKQILSSIDTQIEIGHLKKGVYLVRNGNNSKLFMKE